MEFIPKDKYSGNSILDSITSTFFVSNDKNTKKRGKNLQGSFITAFVSYLVIAFIILSPGKHGEPSLNQTIKISDSFSLIEAISLIFGPIFIYVGWKEFSLYLTLSSIPIAKIEAAAAGLNEFTGNFVSEMSANFIEPLYGKTCLFFSTNLSIKAGRGKNEHTIKTGNVSNGSSLLFTDGTGYLAIDFKEADLELPSHYKEITSDANSDYTNSVFDALEKYDGKDLASVKNAISAPKHGGFFSNSDRVEGDENYITEDASFFVIGETRETGKTFKGKSVKLLYVDPQTKMLGITSETKEKLVKTDREASILSLAFGFLITAASLYYVIK